MNPRRSHPKAGSPKVRKAIDLFLKQIRVEHPFGQPNCEHCVEFSTVMQHLEDLSCGAHQWASLPVTGIHVSSENPSGGYLIVGYSNPDRGLPNALCFCFPLLQYRYAPAEELKLLVCFAPESVVPLSEGLYWEEDELKYDCLEDWDRIWKRLSRCLCPKEMRLHSESLVDGGERQADLGMLTLEGIPYKDSITALVRLWSESRERLQHEIES